MKDLKNIIAVSRQKRLICDTLLNAEIDFEYFNSDFAFCVNDNNLDKIKSIIQAFYNSHNAVAFADYNSDFGEWNITFKCYADNIRVVVYTYEDNIYTKIINIVLNKLQKTIEF